MSIQDYVNEMPYADKKSIQPCGECGRAIIRDKQTNNYFHVYSVNVNGGKSQYFCYPYDTRFHAKQKNPITKDYETCSREDLLKVIQLDDERIEKLEQVIRLIPECSVHGDLCIDNATAWIEENLKIAGMRKEEKKPEIAVKRECSTCDWFFKKIKNMGSGPDVGRCRNHYEITEYKGSSKGLIRFSDDWCGYYKIDRELEESQ